MIGADVVFEFMQPLFPDDQVPFLSVFPDMFLAPNLEPIPEPIPR